MNISKYIKIAAAMLPMLAATGCNDFLDVQPSTETDRDKLFSDEAGYADAMAGVYSLMSSDELYGKNMTWYMVELMGGGAAYAGSDGGDIAKFRFHSRADGFSSTLRDNTVTPIWNKTYNAIANLNAILESIDSKQDVFAGNDYEIFKGEAIGLRAFLHFDLLRLFGAAYAVDKDYVAIPYVASLTSDVYPRLTVEECCNTVVEELKQARDLLVHDPMYLDQTPTPYVCGELTGDVSKRTQYDIRAWHNRRFHFNYYAAVATLARVYLWMGDKVNALGAAKEVIAASDRFRWVDPRLVSNIVATDNSERDRTFSTEHIFALNIRDLQDRIDGYMYAGRNTFEGTQGNLVGINTNCFEVRTRVLDYRYQYQRSSYTYFGSTVVSVSTKYYEDPDVMNYSPWAAHRLPLIKLPEMYYIAAECEPDPTTSAQYLQTVRNNRGLGAVAYGSDNIAEQIEREYRKEFIAEGQLFYFNKRLNIPTQIFNVFGLYSNAPEMTVSPSVYILEIPDEETTYGANGN